MRYSYFSVEVHYSTTGEVQKPASAREAALGEGKNNCFTSSHFFIFFSLPQESVRGLHDSFIDQLADQLLKLRTFELYDYVLISSRALP